MLISPSKNLSKRIFSDYVFNKIYGQTKLYPKIDINYFFIGEYSIITT